MEAESFDLAGATVDPGLNTRGFGAVRFADGANLVEFFWDAVLMRHESEQQNRPIYKKLPHVKITSPGGKSVVVRKVKPSDELKYPKQYAAFKAGEDMAMEGTPVEQWTRIGMEQAATLKHLGIYSVEQLAECGDGVLSAIGMGARELREAARGYLAQAKDSAQAARFAAENERLRGEIADLRALIEEYSGGEAKKPSGKKKSKDDGADDGA